MEWPDWWVKKDIQISMKCLAETDEDETIKTHIVMLDEFLMGGFLTGCIYELVGQAGSGKTNFALALSKQIILQNYKVYFFSTQKAISLPRLNDMNLENNRNLIARNAIALDDKFNYFLRELKNLLDAGEDIKLVVIDNIPEFLKDS